MTNGNRAHDYGFFVGNHPFDLTPQIEKLYEVLDGVCVSPAAKEKQVWQVA